MKAELPSAGEPVGRKERSNCGGSKSRDRLFPADAVGLHAGFEALYASGRPAASAAVIQFWWTLNAVNCRAISSNDGAIEGPDGPPGQRSKLLEGPQ